MRHLGEREVGHPGAGQDAPGQRGEGCGRQRLPRHHAEHRSVRAGLGWGMLVDAQAVEDVRAGRLVRVPGLDDVLVPLYWQAATLPVTRLVRLTRAVREAAQRTLERG